MKQIWQIIRANFAQCRSELLFICSTCALSLLVASGCWFRPYYWDFGKYFLTFALMAIAITGYAALVKTVVRDCPWDVRAFAFLHPLPRSTLVAASVALGLVSFVAPVIVVGVVLTAHENNTPLAALTMSAAGKLFFGVSLITLTAVPTRTVSQALLTHLSLFFVWMMVFVSNLVGSSQRIGNDLATYGIGGFALFICCVYISGLKYRILAIAVALLTILATLAALFRFHLWMK